MRREGDETNNEDNDTRFIKEMTKGCMKRKEGQK